MNSMKKWTRTLLLILALMMMPAISASAAGAGSEISVSKAYTGWISSGSYRYYYRNGVRLTGLQTIDGKRFYFEANGRAHVGWLNYNGNRYYCNSYGRILTGLNTIDGKRFFFDTWGRAMSGWITMDGGRYYRNSFGRLLTGWNTLNGNRHYFNTWGRVIPGWQTMNGHRFYFNAWGRILTGWQVIGGYRYYFNSYGRVLTGWQTMNGQRFYFNSLGRAQTTPLTINGVRYTFNEFGRVISSESTNKVTRRAVVIGQTNYTYASTLSACRYDALAMARMLSKTGYTTVNTKYDATKSTIKSAISSTFASADSNDVSLFYYSGHGSSDGSLCATSGSDRFISTSELAGWLKKVPGTVIVILDSCYSGAVINKAADGSVVIKNAKDFNTHVINTFAAMDTTVKSGEMANSKFQVLTASKMSQVSYAASTYSLFTDLLVDGVGFNYSGTRLSSAPADTDKNSKLSLYECWRYTYYGTYSQDAQYYPTSSTFTLFTR